MYASLEHLCVVSFTNTQHRKEIFFQEKQNVGENVPWTFEGLKFLETQRLALPHEHADLY